MIGRKSASEKDPTSNLEHLLSKDSLELTSLQRIVFDPDFDPSANSNLTQQILLLNNSLINRLICAHPLTPAELRLMVVESALTGSQEALLRPEENLQRAAIKRGNPELLQIVSQHPDLSGELQASLLEKCFIVERHPDNHSYDPGGRKSSTIHFWGYL